MNFNKRWISLILFIFICFIFLITGVEAKQKKGCLDYVSLNEENQLSISGWAIDQDNINNTSIVRIYANQIKIGEITTHSIREDVNQVYHAKGNHGFQLVIDVNDLPIGKYTIQAKVIDEMGNEYLLDYTFQMIILQKKNKIIGYVDYLAYDQQGYLKVSGWAIDQYDINRFLQVNVYEGTTCLGSLRINSYREDVNKAYQIGGNHGYYGKIDCHIKGNKNITVKVLDPIKNTEYELGSVKVKGKQTNYIMILYILQLVTLMLILLRKNERK